MKENLLIFIDFVKKLIRDRYMIRSMALRELKARYIGSFFGFFWAVLNPLFQLAIYGIVFGVFFRSRPDPVYGTDSFFLYLFCGLIPWQFFIQTLTMSTDSIVSNKSLVKKAAGFPSEVLPIITVVTNIISHLIGLLVLLLILFPTVGPSPYTPLVLVYLFLISIFCVGLGWIFSSLNVYLKDIQQVIGLLLTGWFFFTPIFYSPGIIPAKIRVLLELNPMYHVVEGYRFLLLAGRFPPLRELLFLAGVSFFTLAVGGVFFRKLKPGFAEVL